MLVRARPTVRDLDGEYHRLLEEVSSEPGRLALIESAGLKTSKALRKLIFGRGGSKGTKRASAPRPSLRSAAARASAARLESKINETV